MLNLRPRRRRGRRRGGDLGAAVAWAAERGVIPYVPVTPGLPGTAAAEAWLQEHGFEPGLRLDEVRPRPAPAALPRPRRRRGGRAERRPTQEPFGTIAAIGFGHARLGRRASSPTCPGREGWRCYVARVDGEAQACGAMLIEDGIAEFGIGATLEAARGRGCQTALLHRRIVDAAEAGCHTLFVETGERVAGPALGAATATSSRPASRRPTCGPTGSPRPETHCLGLPATPGP